jgi:hypothetical protein
LINPKRIVFYLVFFLVYCFSGLLTVLTIMLGVFQYRMGLVSALVIPLLLIYGIKVSRVSAAYVLLAGVVFLSGLYNHSSLREIILFMRILGFSYLMYMLVETYVHPNNISRIIQLCVAIAVIQLPIVVLQQLLFDRLPARVKAAVHAVDFDFGTFNFKCDATMAFFLTMIVIFLLFDRKRNYIIRRRWMVLFWLTLTVLITNAELVKLILASVWGVYLVRHLGFKTIIYSIGILLFIVGTLAFLGILDEIWSDFTYGLYGNTRFDSSREEAFLSGDYGRGSAVAYYLSEGILWLGDGPSKYYQVFSQTMLRGNTGHAFTFYSEVGLLGLLASVLVFFLIAFPGRGWRMRVCLVGILSFVSIQMLSFTTENMNDIGVVLIYCIIAKSYLIPEKSDELPSSGQGDGCPAHPLNPTPSKLYLPQS